MTIETALKDLINPLLAGGCHNTVNRSNPLVVPYAVFYEISGIPETGITESYLGTTRFHYQVDVIAKSPEAAKTYSLLVGTAIAESAELQGVLTFQMNGEYNEVDKTFQYIMEFEFWYRSLAQPFPLTFPILLG